MSAHSHKQTSDHLVIKLTVSLNHASRGSPSLPPRHSVRSPVGRPTSSGSSCMPALTGCCIGFARPRPAARFGARRHSKRSAGRSAKSPFASRNSNPVSRSPCRPPIHIGKPSSRWQAASPPKVPDPSGTCRRMNPERQPLTALKTCLRKQPSTRPTPLTPSKSAGCHE